MSFNNQRGSALIYIVATMAILSALIDGVLIHNDLEIDSFRAVHEKKQAFYMSEGVRAITTVLVQSYLMSNPSPTNSAVSAYVGAALPPLIPAPFTVALPIEVNILSFTPNAIIATGPFAGMNGPVTTMQIKLNLSMPSSVFGGNVSQVLDMQMSFAYVSMFQFIVFFDVGQAFMETGPNLYAKGRVHSNGDLCVGGVSGTEYFLKITATGRLMANSDNRCTAGGGGGTSNTMIATDGTFTNFARLADSYDNGCTNCNGTGLAWPAFIISRWHKQALDKANSVQKLTLPGAGMGQVQTNQAGGWAAANNTGNLRFIIDPVLPTDSQPVQTYKYAYNADIRIINGVWYLKDPANPGTWPGVPIWSDHPGRFTENGIKVGQDDIRDLWAGTFPWPAAPQTPAGFSYYEYDRTNKTLFADTTGVISYGNLFNTGAADVRWRPGSWVSSGANSLCAANGTINCGASCGLLDAITATPTCPGAAADGRDPNMATLLLNATRGGFRNGHIFQQSPASGTSAQQTATRGNRSRMLPVNFDVKQFQDALANNNPGELGSYFGVGRFKAAGFNGVVFITSTWPGGLSGFGGVGSPSEHPYQGSISDANQVAGAHAATQRALPQPLCSDDPLLDPIKPGLAGFSFDAQGPLGAPIARFTIPNCASYAAGQPIQAYPNVIRIINGRDLNTGTLPAGLSLVSNIPVYLAGDYNTTSTQTSTTSTPWVSSLVGGDKVIMISNAWNDSLSRWDQSPASTDRNASTTTYNTAMISEPSVTLTSLLEDWDGTTMTHNGSLVYGHNEIYALHANYCCGNVTYQPPNRVFNFDPHFSLITNQPPGTPVFPLSAILMWTSPQ